jgi:hypothetical protein
MAVSFGIGMSRPVWDDCKEKQLIWQTKKRDISFESLRIGFQEITLHFPCILVMASYER